MALSVQFNFLVQFILLVLSNFVVINATFASCAALTFYRYVRMHVFGRGWSMFWSLTFVSIPFCSTNSIYFVRTNLPDIKGLTQEAI